MGEKCIEMCRMRAGDLKTGFGNPRKISKKKLEELGHSFEMLGDFGIFLIDEDNNVIGGNQRLKAVLQVYGPEKELDCKRLIGYSEAELRAVNIKDNTHSGEWDLELLADWTADLNLDLGLDLQNGQKTEERSIDEMELVPYEKYNYVLLACRSELDYDILIDKLGLRDKKVMITDKRSIKARAVWYDKVEHLLFGGK